MGIGVFALFSIYHSTLWQNYIKLLVSIIMLSAQFILFYQPFGLFLVVLSY